MRLRSLEVDAGSRGPWLLQDEFQLDFDTYAQIMTRLSLLKGWFKIGSIFSCGLIFGHLYADFIFSGLI